MLYLLVVFVRVLVCGFGACWCGVCVGFVFGSVFAGFVSGCYGSLVVSDGVVCVC